MARESGQSQQSQQSQPGGAATEPGHNGRRPVDADAQQDTQNSHQRSQPSASNETQRVSGGASTTHPKEYPHQQGEPGEEQRQTRANEYDVYGAKNGTAASAVPLNPHTGMPIEPMAQPGYYPGYSTLSQQNFWDEATRNVVLKRVNRVPHIRFFSEDELPLMEAVVARVLPQDDRDEEHKIPIVDYIDERLYSGRIDGYRFEGMPPDKEVHRLGLKGIDACAHHVYGKSFVDLTPHEQDYILETIHDGRPPSGEQYWKQMSVRHFWQLLVQDVLEAYYAHPWAWDEIGFGGPAYPRGYMRLHGGEPEPWEVDEHRYEWQGPQSSLSDKYTYIDLQEPLESQLSGKTNVPGQEGTH